jgi:pseudouridine-5'-monophosphatase
MLPPGIKACFFDMDGLLINTEDLIMRCRDEILKMHDRPPLPWHIKAQLQGRSKSGSDAIFKDYTQLPMADDEYQQTFEQLRRRYFPTCEILPGVETLLRGLTARHMELALVTSSAHGEFEMKTNHHQGLFEVFPGERRVLGDDARIGATRHKPEPDVYLLALRIVNEGRTDPIHASECLVLEDAIPGVLSGRRAGMQVLWCPHAGLLEHLREDGGDDVAGMGSDVGRELMQLVRGECGTGWIRLVESLADFQYEWYGIQTPTD